MQTMPLEAATRHLIDNNLKNLGWEFEAGKKQNVWLEQPKTDAEKKKLRGKRPDYVLYPKDAQAGEPPLAIIEAKRPGERIDKALEQGIDYAKTLNAPLVFATDGVFCKSYHTKFDKAPLLNGDEVDEFVREVTALKFLNDWNVNTVSSKVLYDRKELIKIFDEANNMLRGDGLRAGIERFGEFANILFLKLISENGDRDFWNDIKQVPKVDRINYINGTIYNNLNQAYGTDIFTQLTIRDNAILNEIMHKLDPLTLTDVDSDVKGDAFEYFLRASTASKNDLGEYFTPRHIVKTMVRLVNPQFGEKVYDPFCGTGGFLIETFRYIHNNMPRNPANEELLKKNTIYGNEITNTARITKMNMILAGDGHSGIEMKDSLANPVRGNYDVVLANMPYSQKTKYGHLYDLPSNNGDSVCVQHCMKAINSAADNGRMALVVPEGFLFRKDLAKTREYLLENAQLQSIISLPQGVFLPYTAVKTNIIYATKVNQKTPSSQRRDKYWYFDVKSDGLSLDNHRRKLDNPSDLAKYEEYRKLDDDQHAEMLQVGFECVPLDKVRDNSFILVGSRYRERAILSSNYDMVALKDICVEIFGGGTPSSSNAQYWNGSIAWITSADIDEQNNITVKKHITQEGLENSTSKIIPKESVIIASRVGLGKIAINHFDMAINQDLQGLIIDYTKALPKYIVNIFPALIDELTSKARGTTIKGITKQELLDLSIPLPSLDVQQRIVDELEGYQRVMDGARAVVEGYKPKIHIKDDWAKVKISDIANEIKSGFACGTHNKSEDGILHIRPMNITSKGTLTLDGSKFIDGENASTRKAHLLSKGDVLFNNTNSKELIGKPALLTKMCSRYIQTTLQELGLIQKLPTPNS